MTDFPHVFSPLQLRHRTLANRITFGAHTANLADDGRPGDRHVAYYRERALGGAGMIVVEPVPVHATAVLTRGNFTPGDDAAVRHFRRITEACHQAGEVTMIQQLYHVGQHGDGDNSFAPNWSPSGRPSYHDADGSHAMTELDIDDAISAFVDAARRAQRAGFDGVEVFAAYHALVDQFWAPWSNRRTDRWGGTFENRMRFSRSILERIRAVCGEEFVVGLAVSIDPDSPATPDQDQMVEIVAWHDQRQLMDYVTCGTGSYFDFAKIIPTSLYPERLGEPFSAALVQASANALVQCESHVRTAENAEAVLAAGRADLVSIVRGQIADPHLVAKARQGRAAETRPCISCNQLCWGRRARDYAISCLVNPSAGREHAWGGDRFEPAAEPKRVAVVGGGPAGLETARVAAERGHDVRLYDSAPDLGGQWRLAGAQPSRSAILDHLAWYERELERLGVAVHLGRAFAPTSSLWEQVIVVATGAIPARAGFQRALATVDRLPGIETGRVADVTDVLAGTAEPDGDVLLIDDLGDWRGIGTALYLQQLGCRVGLVTAAPLVAAGLGPSAADGPARRRFAQAEGVDFTHTVITAWDGATGRATLRHLLTGRMDEVGADWLVVAETPVANDPLSESLARSCPHAARHLVGDALSPRKASTAIYDGRKLARGL